MQQKLCKGYFVTTVMSWAEGHCRQSASSAPHAHSGNQTQLPTETLFTEFTLQHC